jgi:hypothetical protein
MIQLYTEIDRVENYEDFKCDSYENYIEIQNNIELEDDDFFQNNYVRF